MHKLLKPVKTVIEKVAGLNACITDGEARTLLIKDLQKKQKKQSEKKEDNFSIETFCKSRNAQKWMPCLSVVQCLSGRDNVRFDLSTIAHVNTAEKYKCQQKAITGLTSDDRRIGNNVIMKRTMLPCYVIKIDREVTYWMMDGVRVSSGVDTVFVFDEQTEGKLKDLLKEENVIVAAHVKLQSEKKAQDYLRTIQTNVNV